MREIAATKISSKTGQISSEIGSETMRQLGRCRKSINNLGCLEGHFEPCKNTNHMSGIFGKERELAELMDGKFINDELTWESWEGKPNEEGEKVYARCIELNVFAGPCSSFWVAIHALTIATLIRIEQLGFRKPIHYFRAELLLKRG